MIRFIFVILICFLFSSCQKIENDFFVYKIKEGKHRSVTRYETIKSDELKFVAIFNSSAIYESKDPVNQLDINKLYGFSDCNSHHQKNSARFGWRWNNNSLEILAYVYNDGERKYQFITTVPLDTEVNYSLKITDDSYQFFVDNSYVIMDRTSNCDVGFHYLLYPYFGGDEPAPHDISISIRDSH